MGKRLADMQNPKTEKEIHKELLAKAQSMTVGGMIKQIYFYKFLFQ